MQAHTCQCRSSNFSMQTMPENTMYMTEVRNKVDDGESGKAYHETDSIVSNPCSGKVFSQKCLNNVREVQVSICREWLINSPCPIAQVGYELMLSVFEVTAMIFEWKVTIHVG